MNEEVLRILKMVEDGKVDAQKGTELIQAINENKTGLTTFSNSSTNKMLKVRVNSTTGDNVNVNLPVKFIKAVGNAINKLPQIQGIQGLENIDIKLILEAIDNDINGKIVDVKSQNGDIVEVSIE